MINGIVDLSHWNVIHDIPLFKSWGANALITKATEGLTFKDDSYASKKQVAMDMSIPFGAYHFGRGFDGKQQADFFLSVVNVEKNPNTLLILDFEMSMTLKQAEDFVNEIFLVTKTYPAIYTRKTYMDVAVGTRDTILSKCPLWVAQYGESPNIPVQWTNYFLWQYTDGTYGPEPHVVPGVGNGDRSQYKGTWEELKTDWMLYSNPIVVGPIPPKIIDVPYTSQWAKEGDKFREDCGPACLDMLLKWKAGKDGVVLDPNTTINSLASESTLANKDTGITVENLVSIAVKHSLDVSEVNRLNINALMAQIDAGKPCISLIHYGFISGREDIGYTEGHFVVVNGYDDNYIYVNDPDWTLKSTQGKNFKILKTEFTQAVDYYQDNGMVFNSVGGITTTSTRYVTATLLNVRSEAVIKNGNVLFQLKMGDKVEVNLNASQGQFVPLLKVNDVPKTGWISNTYLSSFPVTPVDPNPLPPVPPTPPIIHKNTQKIGLHIMPGANNDLLMGLLMTKKIPGVTLIRSGWGGEMTVKAIKTVSPDTKVLLRWYADNWEHRAIDWTVKDLAAKGDQWVNDYFVNMIQNRDPQDSLLADYHQIINEPPFGPGTASFWMGALGAAKKRNIKLGIFCFSMGYPPLPNETNSPWSGYYDVMRQAKAEGHVLMLHEYTIPEKTGKWDEVWGIARHKQLYGQFPSDLKDMPLIIGEFGDRYGLARGNGFFMDNVKVAYNNMKEDTQIISANLWTFGGMGAWQSDLLDGATKDLQNWVIGVG